MGDPRLAGADAGVRTGVRIWNGPRPMTPDGLPVIGRLPGYRNLIVASGHAMLGVTLAPATGEAVAELITTGHAPDVITPFDPHASGERGTPTAPTMATKRSLAFACLRQDLERQRHLRTGQGHHGDRPASSRRADLERHPLSDGTSHCVGNRSDSAFRPGYRRLGRSPSQAASDDRGRHWPGSAVAPGAGGGMARRAAHRALAGHRVSGRHALCFLRDCLASYLPVILSTEDLTEGNARLHTGWAIAEIGGPGLAGWLTQLFAAPIAILVDGVSYIASAALLVGIRVSEPPPSGSLQGSQPSFRRKLEEGLRVVVGNPILRATAARLVSGISSMERASPS